MNLLLAVITNNYEVRWKNQKNVVSKAKKPKLTKFVLFLLYGFMEIHVIMMCTFLPIYYIWKTYTTSYDVHLSPRSITVGIQKDTINNSDEKIDTIIVGIFALGHNCQL